MQALDGSLKYRTASALAAGCDVALHCNGMMLEMAQVAMGSLPLGKKAIQRVERANDVLHKNKLLLDGSFDDSVKELEAMMTL